jgi:hypothetical protein
MRNRKGTGTIAIEVWNTSDGIADPYGTDMAFLRSYIPCVGDYELVITFKCETWCDPPTLEYPGDGGEERKVIFAKILANGELYKNLPSSMNEELYDIYHVQIDEEPVYFDEADYDRD